MKVRKTLLSAFFLIGFLVLPLVLCLRWPRLPSLLEQAHEFCWVGAEPATGRPLLLRTTQRYHEILAGSSRAWLPGNLSPACGSGSVDGLRSEAREAGRIESLTVRPLPRGMMWLTLEFPRAISSEHFLYHCDDGFGRPVLSWTWGILPQFGLRFLFATALLWFAIVAILFRRMFD